MIFDCMVMYNVHTGVMMAARSLLQLFREKNPALLLKKDRVSNHGNHHPRTRKIKELCSTGQKLVSSDRLGLVTA